MSQRATGSQPVILTPHYVAHHNGQANAVQLEHGHNILYIGNAHFSFDTNRRVFLIMNDRGNAAETQLTRYTRASSFSKPRTASRFCILTSTTTLPT